ncbi:MAG TPA: type II toxin-antitoxin system VapC family toxin [Solirubrobacteraceae bacterium]|nr:type II toxin-antitoxin system VapC family toxin [Solirubrobacteraceae bacterium]
MSVLLDTTVLIDVLRGRPGTIERLRSLRRQPGVPCTTAINVEEIHRGLRDDEEAAVDQLFNGLRVVDISRAHGELAGHWRRDHAAAGVTLAQADCLIAATAVALGIPLATGNPRHFPIPELDLQHWPVGA